MRLRFGLVGAGGIARSYVQVFAGMEDAAIIGVADPDAGAAQRLADDLGARTARSLDELLANVDLDGVIVCTPPNSHPEVALAAINAGVGVLCEKPLAIGIDAARTMIAAAAGGGVPFTMATKFRFVDDVVGARELVRSGVVGDIIQLENTFASRVDMAGRWNSNPAISGGGVLIDNGTHSVDIARYFLGPIQEVLVVERPRTQDVDVEDSVQLLLRTASDATATIDLSWSYDNATDTYLQIYGTDGALRVGWAESSCRENQTEEWIPFGIGYDKVRCMRNQVENFCAALRGTEPLAITAADAIASVQVISAAYRSLELGDWVSVESVQSVDSASDVA
jgi:Predicted dehydrogenases and related proteins